MWGGAPALLGTKREREEDEGESGVLKLVKKEAGGDKEFVKEIPCSTIILASNSDYFKTMFTGQFRERSGKKQADIYLEPDGKKSASRASLLYHDLTSQGGTHHQSVSLEVAVYFFLLKPACQSSTSMMRSARRCSPLLYSS